MSPTANYRSCKAAEREEKKLRRALERRTEEQAKLSQLEQARLEVETFENRLNVLLSVHKEQGDAWNWSVAVATLPQPYPRKQSHHEFKASLRMAMEVACKKKPNWDSELEKGRLQDKRDHEEALKAYSSAHAEWEKLQRLSRRILSGDHAAYDDALSEMGPLTEIAELGSSLRFVSHSVKLLDPSSTVGAPFCRSEFRKPLNLLEATP